MTGHDLASAMPFEAWDGSVVIFIHLPKTAGTTLKSIIKRQYGRSEILFAGAPLTDPFSVAIQKYNKLSETEKSSIKIIAGHTCFGLHDELARSCNYITVLRDPTERIISGYYHLLREPDYPQRDKLGSLREFLSEEVWIDMDNGQTRRISGAGATIPYGQCSSAMLERAKANIDRHFSMVGLTERFDETVILFKRRFGWNYPFYIKKNRTPRPTSSRHVPANALTLIEKHVEFDRALYDYAKAKFEAHIADLGPSFRREVRVFGYLNNSLFSTRMLPSRLVKRIGREYRMRQRKTTKE